MSTSESDLQIDWRIERLLEEATSLVCDRSTPWPSAGLVGQSIGRLIVRINDSVVGKVLKLRIPT